MTGSIPELLFESAVRSLLLGACVFAGLKLARLRDMAAETSIWTVILIVAVSMPLLDLWLPGGVAVPLPRVAWLASTSPHLPPGASGPAPTVGHSAVGVLWGLYCLIALAGLARLATGLALTWRLYRSAEPIAESWARGRKIRASAAIGGPLSFADRILLPADYPGWSSAKLAAVLAHEDAHIRRGDFFILLLASAHRAVFWLSPFAWWLQFRLGELAETASDAAAIRQIADPAGYAEILIEVTRRARGSAILSAVPMARGPGVARRVDHILSGAPEQALSGFGRALAVAVALTLSLGFVEVRAAAAGPPDAVRSAPPARTAGVVSPPSATAPHRASAGALAVRAPLSRRRARPAPEAAGPVRVPQADDVAYDPRALLEDDSIVATPAFILTGAVGRATPPANAD